MLEHGQYDQSLSRQYPGLLVILLDQSISMAEKVEENGQRKADILATYVNSIIRRTLEFAQVDEYTGRRKNIVYVCVLGYSDSVHPLLSSDFTTVPLSELDDNPKGFVIQEHLLSGHLGTPVRSVKEKVRFWIEPRSEGKTEMARAFEVTEYVIKKWLNSSPEYISDIGWQMPRSQSFPPIVIHLTDAKHNGEGDPELVAQRIRNMGTVDGNVLLCNCIFLHDGSEPCYFPKDIREIGGYSQSKMIRLMFNASSVMPDTMLTNAHHQLQMPIQYGARLFISNGNPDIILKLLRWTTLGRIGRA